METYTSSQTRESVSLYGLASGHYQPQSNCISSHAENTNVLQPNAVLTKAHRLLVTNKGQQAFPSVNNCQGQLQTPQSV